MDFYGKQVLALASPASAESLFTAERARSILHAAYSLRSVAVSSVDLVRVKRASVLGATPLGAQGQFSVTVPGQGGSWEGQLRILRDESAPAFDSELRVVISASARTATTAVTDVRTTNLSADLTMGAVDSRIMADDGALPTDPGALEERRRVALVSVLLDRFERPEDWDAEHFWREQSGRDLTEVVERYSSPRATLAAAIDLVVEPDAAPRSIDFTLDLSVLVVPSPFEDLRSTIDTIRRCRGALAASASQSEPVAGAVLRGPVPVAVVFESGALDDADLPILAGANPTNAAGRRTARLEALNDRLASAGVAFVPV
ncbi:hypothetical protein [Salinibacterium sp. SWN167]|uniref:hypothetical protein n=1 Tax=Salinibacterium sp. SWN167 TaxID=2792054 RepID=UPI0018CEBCAF|nr:hypothetical protein [Salinibacterium sp. SWN167]MBH0082387.1 hypothetical protein [Salinibacterium sp. SWN167]